MLSIDCCGGDRIDVRTRGCVHAMMLARLVQCARRGGGKDDHHACEHDVSDSLLHIRTLSEFAPQHIHVGSVSRGIAHATGPLAKVASKIDDTNLHPLGRLIDTHDQVRWLQVEHEDAFRGQTFDAFANGRLYDGSLFDGTLHALLVLAQNGLQIVIEAFHDDVQTRWPFGGRVPCIPRVVHRWTDFELRRSKRVPELPDGTPFLLGIALPARRAKHTPLSPPRALAHAVVRTLSDLVTDLDIVGNASPAYGDVCEGHDFCVKVHGLMFSGGILQHPGWNASRERYAPSQKK